MAPAATATVTTEPAQRAGFELSEWLNLCWSVVAKGGARVPFRLNGCQRILDYEIERARRAGIAALLKVIKLRQGGISTYGCARLQDAAQCLPDYACLSVADKLSLPRIWLDRAEDWHGETPGAPARERSNAQELVLGNGSRYVIASAEGTTPGMGATLRALHCSEIGFWRRPAKIMGDLFPAVPLADPNALVLLESCGEMEGSWWHSEILRTLERDDAFTLIFLPWFLAPEYTADPASLAPDAYTDEERALVAHSREWALGNPVHAGLGGFDGDLTPGQIAWRRWAIANLFSGDVEMFACRYPASISEAFMGVGSQAIPVSITRHHQSTAREPIAVGRLEWAGGGGPGGGVEWVGDERGAWAVYETGYEFCEYAVGADVAEGRSSDPADERADRDWSTAGVLNRRTLSTVATFRARVEADAFGDELLKAAKFWGDAWMSPECNAAGMATLARVREYPYLMPRDGTPDQLDDRALDRLGWRTTPTTRDQLIDEWIAACQPTPAGDYEGRVSCLCPTLAGEERTFVRTATGKREHRPGCFLPGTMITGGFDRVAIDDMAEGRHVLTHKGNSLPSSDHSARHYDGQVVSLKVSGLPVVVECTPEHPILAKRRILTRGRRAGERMTQLQQGHAQRPPPTEWVPANVLASGDWVAIPKRKGLWPTTLSQDQLYAVGFWLAEGNLSRRGIDFTNTHRPYLERIAKTLSEWFPLQWCKPGHYQRRAAWNSKATYSIWGRSRRGGTKPCYTLRFNSTYAREYFAQFGSGCDRKALPPYFYQQGGLVGIVSGWLDGDGSQRRDSQRDVSGCTTSEALAWQFRQILLDAGVWSTLSARRAPPQRKKPYWILNIKSSYLHLLPRCKVTVPPGVRACRHVLEDADCFWTPIRGVARRQYSGPVYNMTVTGDNSYVAGGIAVHNCHDDTLFAYMIALQVHRRCPHVRKHASPVTRAELRAAVDSGERLDSRFGGGVDTWALDLDDAAEADGY